MAIMTLLVSYNNSFPNFYICFSTVEEYIAKMSKTNKSNSAMSVSIDNGRFKNFSVFSRCNSFSSCSNDSAVYCGHHTIQTRFRNAKRAVVNNSSGPRKRSRNSSGSSISSNMSCISDKDLKSAKVLSPTLNKTEIKNCVSKKSDVSRLKYSKINSSTGELKEETNVNKELNCSENSLVILPNRHNLRGKITKKGCTCCPSTCTTVFLRHYKKFVQTTDENTVISSTKVKTFVQKSSVPSTPVVNNESNVLSNKSKSRKRRSEIEKLYESLHEIEWAKNFSPDNILTQINVRQAASCSAFGKTQNTRKCSRPTVCRKKNLSHFCDDISSPFNKSECTKPNFSVTDCSKSNCKESGKSVLSRESGTLQNCDNEQKVADLQTTEITTSDIYHCKKNYKSCSSQSSVNITCSMSHINLKEININSVESVHTRSLLTENCADSSDDAQLSYASDESSSAVSASIVNIQSKHLLDLDFKDKKQPISLSETDVSEFSPTPTFFDIAEEGIRTIDACFREVGAEVVVSTCYDEDSSLPLLTSITENKISSKVLSNADPPILEPCIDVAFKQNFNCSSKNNYKKVHENNKLKQNTSLKTQLKNIYDKNHHSLLPKQGNSQIKVQSQRLKMKRALLHNIDLITISAAKGILKKYIKQSRTRLKKLSNNLCKFTVKKSEPLSRYESSSRCIKSCTVLNKTTINLPNHQSPVLLSSPPKPMELSFKSPDKKTKFIFQTEEKCSGNRDKKLPVKSVQNSSCLFQSGKILKCSSKISKASVISQRKSSGPKPTVITSFISTKIEKENGIKKDRISRPLPSLEISYDYNSIKVNRKMNYIQIILQFTRGKSVFLTLEALTELRDVLNRANNDSQCQVLIVNAEGDSFCLGLDLKPLIGPRKKTASTEIAVAVKELIEALSEFKKPLAAVVKGPALGLGMTLLNHADFTIASEKATFCMPYSYLGYMPEGGATLTLPQIVGSTVAMDLLLRGKTLTAREAYNAGLISEVLEAKRLPYEFVSRVKMLAENPLSALETTKALLKMQLHVNLQLVLENEVKLLPRMWLTRTCQDSLRKALESGILS